MIEFLVYALLSEKSADFFASVPPRNYPSIEILEPSKIPQKTEETEKPKLVEAEGVVILAQDVDSGKNLFSKDAARAQEIASLTKLMTVFLILEEHDMDEVVNVSESAAKTPGASIDLYAYERITVRTLLEATLIGSANDAAVALAVHNSGSESEFAEKMNKRARSLGLFSAEFFNATGLDLLNPKTKEFYGNKMSARDILQLARILLRSDFVRETVQKEKFVGTSVDEEFYHEKDTTNDLLGLLGLKGLKTGTTNLAGQCFIALGETAEGNEVLTVILGSEDRFGETAKLLRWIYKSFDWR